MLVSAHRDLRRRPPRRRAARGQGRVRALGRPQRPRHGPRQPERRPQVVRQPNRARRARLRDRAARPRRRRSARTAPASRRCCASSPGSRSPTRARRCAGAGIVVSFLPQHPLGDERNALETVRAARPDLDELDRELHRVAEQLASPELAADLDKMARVLRRQEELVERWEAAGGPSIDGRARAMLLDVGLEEADLTLPTSALSGGQRKLIALAACLAQDPGRAAARRAGGAPRRGRPLAARAPARRASTAPSSPSRTTATCSTRPSARSPSSTGGRIRMWPGNYSAYTLARELELQRQQQQYVTQQKEIERLEAAIRRFKDWARRVVDERHIKQARNKQRQIDRMEKVERPVLERRKIALRLHPHERGGQRVFELRHVGMQFGERRRARRRRADGRARRARRLRRRERRRQERAAEDGRRRARADRGRGLGRPVDPDRLPRAGPGDARSRVEPARHGAARAPLLRGRGRRAADEVPLPVRAGAPARTSSSRAASGRGCSCCC